MESNQRMQFSIIWPTRMNNTYLEVIVLKMAFKQCDKNFCLFVSNAIDYQNDRYIAFVLFQRQSSY